MKDGEGTDLQNRDHEYRFDRCCTPINKDHLLQASSH